MRLALALDSGNLNKTHKPGPGVLMIQQLSLRGTERKERTYTDTRDLNPGCCLVTKHLCVLNPPILAVWLHVLLTSRHFQSNLTTTTGEKLKFRKIGHPTNRGNFQLQFQNSSSLSGGGLVKSSKKKVDNFPTFSVKQKVEALKLPVVSHCSFFQIGERYNKKL